MADKSADRSDIPSASARPRSRTGTAARVFFKALLSDLAAFWRGLGRPRQPAPTSFITTGGRPSLRFCKAIALLLVLGLLIFCGTMLWALRGLPLDNRIAEGREREILLEASNGAPLGRVGPLEVSNASREEFPPLLVNAVLSIEDRRFYQHWGIDFAGIARAARRNYEAGTILEGGSTLTQQLVKLRLLNNERTYGRKLREAFAALWLEMRLSKDEILTRYLNSVYMGAGAQGIPAAARLYFNKRPSELTLPEAALLAGLIKAPSRFNPLRDMNAARARAAAVLDAMLENRVIDKRTAAEAKAHPAVLSQPHTETENATWFSDWVAQEAQDVTGSFAGTMRVRTTLDPELQSAAVQVIADALKDDASRNVTQGALVAMRPDGAVVAMVGGRNYRESQFNRAVQAQRQPGSAFKLFVYMAALRSGMRLDDTIDASPVDVNGWRPENYGGRDYGTLTLADAFAHSINTAAVRLALKVGLDQVVGAARDLGIDTPLPRYPSLALGSASVSLLNLTAAYAAVLAGRMPVRPWGVASFASPNSRLMSVGPLTGQQRPLGDLRDPLIQLLQLPVQQGTAREAALDGFAAGKTGTTQNHKDAWFIGFNDSLVVGIWVGNDDGSPMDEVTGGSLPAKMWKSFMMRAAPPRVSKEPPAEAVPPAWAEAPAERQESREQPSAEGAQQEAQCDFRACAAKYQSFSPVDCSYQPYDGGPRRKCEKSAQPAQFASAPASPQSSAQAKPAHCNYDACAQTYSSFRQEDCTYQPFDGGPRRLCER